MSAALVLIDLLKSLVSGSEFEGRVYIAGGYVRDELLSLQPKDVDLVVDAPGQGGIRFAEFVARRLGTFKEGSNPVIFPRFGTSKLHFYGVVHNGTDLSDMEVECVAPRTERYDDRSSRKPDIEAGTLKEEVERRDFTANSLLKSLTTDEVVDLTGRGVQDLRAGILRTPLDPEVTFDDDPLRMLRAIRFAVKYGWHFAPGLQESIVKNAARLAIISKERVRDELEKMLVSNDPARAIVLLMETGLIEHVHPNLARALHRMLGMEQNAYHHLDVFHHVLEVVRNSSPSVATRLSALFHDISKPDTRTPHKKRPGEYSFLGHEDEGEVAARQIMHDLKFPGDLIEQVAVAVQTHMGMKDPREVSNKAIRKWARKVGPHLDIALDLMRADAMGHHPDHRNHEDPGDTEYLRHRIAEVGADQPKNDRQKTVTGHDIMNTFGLTPGPHLGPMLALAQDMVDEDPEVSKEAILEALAARFFSCPPGLTID